MKLELSASAKRVQDALRTAGLELNVVELPSTTRTAKEAAQAIGCTTAQIAKSIVFRGSVTGKPVLVIASGTNRINEAVIAQESGEQVTKADADFVRSATTYAIGGVPPVGFPAPIETWLDVDLLKYKDVWAAAGTPFSVFRLEPSELGHLTGGQFISLV